MKLRLEGPGEKWGEENPRMGPDVRDRTESETSS